MGRKHNQDEINAILGDLGNITQKNYVAPTVNTNVAPAMAVVAQQPRTVQPTVSMPTATNTTQQAVQATPTVQQTEVEPKRYNSDGYEETNEKYGDYKYQDYLNKKDYKIYRKDGKAYYYDEKTNRYVDMDEQTMVSPEEDKKQHKIAVENGFIDKKTYKNGEQVRPSKIADRVALNSFGLSEQEKEEYNKSLIRQEKDKDKELSYVRRGGAGLAGFAGELQNVGKNVEDIAIDPLRRAPSSYQYGKLTQDLSNAYYNQLVGKDSEQSIDEISRKLEIFNQFNKDVTDTGNQLDQYFRNLPNEISGIKSGIKGGGVLGAIGAIGGGAIGLLGSKDPATTLAFAEQGAKLLGGAGYVKGQAENTFRLEAGAQYQALLEMGVPEDIAREEALKVGTANALIESGESILDLVTLGKSSLALDKLKDGLAKKYGLDFVKNLGTSYLTNVLSEGVEETAQEGVSIASERGAAKKAGIERDNSQDLSRLGQSALSGAFGAAISGGATRMLGSTANTFGNTALNNLTDKANERQQTMAISDAARQQSVDNTKQMDYNNDINEREGTLNGREITGTNETGINQEINREQSTNDSRTSGEGDGGVRVLNETKDYKQVKDNIDNLKATHKRGAFFNSYTENEFKTFKTYQTPDGKSSISIKPDGDITALVSEGKKGMATDLLMKARENGGTKMDCYGKFLKELYEQHGFKAVARVHYGRGYNEQMDNYIDNAIKEGKAKDDSDFDIYFMMKNNDDVNTVRNNIGKYETTNIEDLPYMDYDEAYKFRDSQLEQQGSGEGETNAIVKSDGNVVTAPIGTKGDNKLANIEINVNDGGNGGNNNNNTGLSTRDNGEIDDARILENYKDRKANKKASFKERVDDFLHSVVRGVFDRGEIIDRIGKNHNDKELYPLYDFTFTADGSANFNIGDNKDGYQTNLSGEKVGESLNNCWKPVEDAGLVRQMNAYLYELHNIDRWNQFNEDGTRKFVFSENHSDEVSKKNIEELLRIFPQLEDMAKPILQYQKNLLNISVESGQVSQKMADNVNKIYKNYIPTWRDKDKQSYSSLKKGLNNISVDNPLKQATGSKEDLLPLKEVQAQMTKNVFKSAKMNLFGQQLFKDIGDLNKLKDIGMQELKGISQEESFLKEGEQYLDDYLKKLAPNNIPVDTVSGEKTMTVYFDGKKVSMPINDEIETALKPAKPNNKLAKFTSKINDFKRGVITQYNPGFSISNALKDAPDAMLNSKYGKEFPAEYAKTMKEMLDKGLKGKDLELFNQYCALGAYSNSVFDTTEGFKTDSKLKKTVGFIPNVISDVNDVIEQIPRFTEFKLSLKHGATLSEAMYNAAEVTTNFKRGGTFTKALDAYGTTFLNASMAGFYKQLRNITEQPNGTAFLKFTGKLMALGLTPAIINSLLYASPFGDDEDKKEAKEAYESLRQYEKDDYLLWYMGDGKFLKIPKGRAVSIPAIVYNAAMNKAQGKKGDLKETINSILNQIGPNNPLSNNTILSFSQVKLFDPKSQGTSWSGTPIESSFLQDKRPGQRYDSKTDEFSKWLGDKLDVSPKKINYLLKQNSGIIGDMVLPFITAKPTGKSELSRFSNFLTNRFSTDTVTSNNITEEFYDRLTEYKWDKNDSRPEVSTPMAEVKSKYMGSRSSEIAEIRKEIEAINADKNISKNDKYEQTREMQKEINDIAKDALVNVDKIKKVSDKEYQVGEKYYVMKDGQMSAVKDETIQSAKDYGLSIGDYVDITGYYNSIKADKDANGKTIQGSKKQKYIDYVEAKKELTREQKIAIINKYVKYSG